MRGGEAGRLPACILNRFQEELVPGNIRKAEHFLGMLKRFTEFLRHRVSTAFEVGSSSESPALFLGRLKEIASLQQRPLSFFAERLYSLDKNLGISDYSENDYFSEDYYQLQKVANFATLVSSYAKGFVVITEAGSSAVDSIIHLVCLDASLAIAPVFQSASSVIITSGTLSPLDMLPKILGFSPVLLASFPMSLPGNRNPINPLIVSRGSDQVPISSRFQNRGDTAIIRNYGSLLLEFSKVTPDGLIAFFPSYVYLQDAVKTWHEMVNACIH